MSGTTTLELPRRANIPNSAPVRIATAAVSSAAAIHALLRSERQLHRASARSKRAFSLCVIGILSHFGSA